MSRCNLNIHDFYKRYQENYDWLYNGGDQISDYDTLWEEFDNLCAGSEGFCSFVGEFCDFMGDLIISDREEAAFILTFHDFVDKGTIEIVEVA